MGPDEAFCPWRRILLVTVVCGLLFGLPWLGLWALKVDLDPYLEFPPRTRYGVRAAFSWPAFWTLAVLISAVLLPFDWRVWQVRRGVPVGKPKGRWPWWGWAGLLGGTVSWVLAWTRFSWFAPAQALTFTPLWISYILTVQAWTQRRAGCCMLTQRPLRFVALFPVSAIFWWYFEHLNRFVQNWFYVGIQDFSAWQYFWYATLSFSTVLPAVLGTADLLGTFPRIAAGLERFWPLRVSRPKLVAAIVLGILGISLCALAAGPHLLFPMLWVSPLGLVLSFEVLLGYPTILGPIARGDWRAVYRLALAALICGFFWELWNYGSLARWIYAVPWVGRFKLFEMPVLGYAGYLPFGLECAVVADLLGLWSPSERTHKADEEGGG